MLTPKKMNKEQRCKLLKLNQKLLEIEFLIRDEKKKLEIQLTDRILNHEWFNKNFNIRFSLEFYSDVKDIANIDYYVGDEKEIGNNFNLLDLYDINFPEQKEFHCYLYYQLYMHSSITDKKNMWDIILKIEQIGVFSTVTCENIFNIKENII